MTLKNGQLLTSAEAVEDKNAVAGIRKIKIPASGATLTAKDRKKLFETPDRKE